MTSKDSWDPALSELAVLRGTLHALVANIDAHLFDSAAGALIQAELKGASERADRLPDLIHEARLNDIEERHAAYMRAIRGSTGNT